MQGAPPWHMWGNTVVVKQTEAFAETTTQLVKVAYKRPESWSFYLACELVDYTTPPGTDGVFVAINLMTGVGRSLFDTKPGRYPLESFAVFNWVIAGGQAPESLPYRKRWATSVRGPQLNDEDEASAQPIDRVVAQDIQAEVLVRSSLLPTVRVSAFFAPFSHVRPDWFAVDVIDPMRFRGQETKGT